MYLTFWCNECSFKEFNCFNSAATLETSNSVSFDNFGIDKNSAEFLLKHLRLNHLKNIIIGHLNINFIRNKFDLLNKMVTDRYFDDYGDKIDDFFSASQFLIQGFCTLFRLGRKKNDDGILLYIRSNITSAKLNKYIIKNQIEAFLWIRNSIWLLFCSYNPNKLQIASHSQEISNRINTYCNIYENIWTMGDFNGNVKEVGLHLFLLPFILTCFHGT